MREERKEEEWERERKMKVRREREEREKGSNWERGERRGGRERSFKV